MKECKKLRIWNGGLDGRGAHVYIAAYSLREAARLLEETRKKVFNVAYELNDMLINRNSIEIRDYFSEGCWGNPMEGVTPERGVWYAPALGSGQSGKPERGI